MNTLVCFYGSIASGVLFYDFFIERDRLDAPFFLLMIYSNRHQCVERVWWSEIVGEVLLMNNRMAAVRHTRGE